MNEDLGAELAAAFERALQSGQIRGTIPPDDYYKVVETELEKISSFFSEKWESFRGNDGRDRWNKYLTELGLDHIISETYLADPTDFLLEKMYSGDTTGKVVIKDPDHSLRGFIVMPKEFAEKVLVLGGLP